MLITDTCSNRVQTPPPIARVFAKVQSRERRYTKNLFLEHSGFLDITAASEGQYAWGNDEIGGYFTISLIGSFTADADENRDQLLSWEEVFDVTRSKTQQLFSETTFLPHNQRKLDEIHQTTQTPINHKLPKKLTQQPPSLSETTVTLTVTSVPSGASVYIDGVWAGKTPLIDHVFHIGRHDKKLVQLELRLKNYKSKVGEWTAKKGQKRQRVAWRDVHLEKLAVPNIFETIKKRQKVDWRVHLEKPAAPSISKTITGKDGAEMVLIPAGEFKMGSTDNGGSWYEPRHTVYVDAFYMDKYAVTNAQYKEFVLANPQWQKGRIDSRFANSNYLKPWSRNNYPSGKGNHPVTYMSWYAAMAYAEWADKRLPTEAEWEKAARGGLTDQKYPWGNSIDFSKANYARNVGTTTPVGSYSPNGYGLYDMAGNVNEWCLDAWIRGSYASSPRRNPIAGASTINQIVNNFLNIKGSRVLRGGSWAGIAIAVRCFSRFYNAPSNTNFHNGFRCARSVTP